MATYNKFETFVGDLGNGTHDLRAAGDTLRVYLSNATPSTSADSVKADLAEITAGNGYTSGGDDMQQDYSETSGTGTMTATDITVTASGGSVGPFQYPVAYNDTPSSPADPLMAYWDYGSPLTLADGETFTVDFGASVLTIT